MYDQTGSTESPFENGGEGMNYEDMFSQFASQFGGGFKGGNQGFDPSIFEDFMGMFGGGQGKGRQQRAPPADIVVNLEIDFKESVFGVEKEIKYFHRVKCGTCDGTKIKPGTKPKKCNACQGKGNINYRQGGFMVQM